MSTFLFLTLFLLSLSCAVFFAGSETGILSVDSMTLRKWEKNGSRGARTVLKMLKNKDVLLATMLVGNNFAVVSASAVATSYFSDRFGPQGSLISIIFVSGLILVFGEILPKAIYLTFGTRLLTVTYWLITMFVVLFRPVVHMTMLLPRLVFHENKATRSNLTRQDIQLLVKTSVLAGDLAREERLMISRLLDLKDCWVASAMVPIVDVAMVSDTAKVRDAHRVIRTRGVSRLPVYNERTDNIMGVVFATDLLRCVDPSESITGYCRKPNFVPEQKTIIGLFEEFYRRLEIAIVVDEYGVATGIITMEDMVEKVIGDIQDEYDEETTLFQPLSTGGYLLDSRLSILEFNERFGKLIPPGDYVSVAGFLMMIMQKVPGRGEQVTFGDARFVILDASPKRVGRVVVSSIENRKNPADY